MFLIEYKVIIIDDCANIVHLLFMLFICCLCCSFVVYVVQLLFMLFIYCLCCSFVVYDVHLLFMVLFRYMLIHILLFFVWAPNEKTMQLMFL